jgi:hypothetical protein
MDGWMDGCMDGWMDGWNIIICSEVGNMDPFCAFKKSML